MKSKLGRRMMLRGAFGTVIGLPLLEIMLDGNGEAYADGGTLPCRYFLMQCPTALVTSGSHEEGMTPSRTGFDYDIRPVLSPLAERGIAADVSVISGLFVPPVDAPGAYDEDYHGYATYAILTGARSGFEGPEYQPSGVSADQIIANAIGSATRLPFLYYQLDSQTDGSRVCFEARGGEFREIAPQISPAAAYRSLMMEYTPSTMVVPDPEAELERRLRQSSLSYARERISALEMRLGAADRQILDEHLTRIRALELRLMSVAPPSGEACADPGHAGSDPPDVSTDVPDQNARASLFVDLIEMAFACDITRTITLGGASALTGPGMRHEMWNHIGGLHGEVQHTADQPDLDDANRFFVDVYAEVVERLKTIPRGAGTALDETAAVFVMEGGKGLSEDPERSGDGGGDPNHSVDNAVMLLAGRAGGLRSGQHVDLSGRDLHTAVVLNTAIRALGVTGTLGDITTSLDELF
jgi:hypothetical protein